MIYQELKKKHFNVYFLSCIVRTTTPHGSTWRAWQFCWLGISSYASSPFPYLPHHFSPKGGGWKSIHHIPTAFHECYCPNSTTHSYISLTPYNHTQPHTIISHQHHHNTNSQIISEVIPTLPIRQSAATLTLPSIDLFIHPQRYY